MSYDAGFWLPLVCVACLLGGLFVALGRPLVGATIAGVVAAAFFKKLRWIPAYEWGDAATYPPPGGWFVEHVTAQGVWQRAEWAGELLVWAAPPLLVCALGVWSAASQHRWAPLLLLPAAAPSAVLCAWIAAAAFVWAPDDPRWALGYVREWQAAGRPPGDGGACLGFLQARGALEPMVPAEELRDAEEDCRRLCARQAEAGYTPAAIRHVCRSGETR